MKVAKIVILAMVVALTSSGLAMAAGSVQMNQAVAVTADVQNTAGTDLQAAVRLLAYDNVGNEVGHVCREVTLAAGDITTVSYEWRAPSYETGLYWSSKVDVNGNCDSQDTDPGGTNGTGRDNDHNYKHSYKHGDSDSDK